MLMETKKQRLHLRFGVFKSVSEPLMLWKFSQKIKTFELPLMCGSDLDVRSSGLAYF
ncbi:hypothetical protein CYPRO_1631 [Cyclonatronum proteinivorum]|uniref:Uncharacterized protein n=1 Tax=Cyclonatronum proteinivorum TaxID=1457365 RepID=A0A345UK80_9BACT|nr:hypothetical protein CYPRO_1631 [Cyclonatronum proteinivorum]